MKTKIIKMTENIEQDKISQITKAFKDGKLVVFPTETVYGLGADGFNEEACENIFKAKGRPGDNPLILHIAENSQLDELVSEIPEVAEKCMEKFWPGPLTMIFKRSDRISDIITAGLETVAVRMPSHKIARAILNDVRLPIAAPSANLSGRPSPTSFKHCYEDLNGKVDILVDGGSTNVGIESTVLDVTSNPPMILRPGGITMEELREIIPDVTIDSATIDTKDKKIPKSPGQKYKHYAPKADAYCFAGDLEGVVKEINKRIVENSELKIAVLGTEETVKYYEGAYLLINLGSRENMEDIAHNLFDALRTCDEKDVDLIYTEGFAFSGIGVGIMNRLLKACGGKVILGL